MSKQLLYKDSENSEFGKNPYHRSLEELFSKGFVIVDKHKGSNSHQVADTLKEILPISKSGHSGTLDPQVTGVLLIGMGRATRLMEYMLQSNKEYICLCYFHKSVSDEELKRVFSEFRGDIYQLPPIVSAVKREKRKRSIYELELLDTDEENKYVLFRVSCQHGTYIRKLCTDMGAFLGINAQMIELRRTKAGPLCEKDGIISLDKLRNLYELYIKSEEREIFEGELKKYIKPMEELVQEFNCIIIRDSSLKSLSHGTNLAIPGVLSYSDSISLNSVVALFTGKGELVAMGRALMSSQEITDNNKGYCVEIEKVFIDNID